MKLACPRCRKVLKVPDAHAGKKGKCPGCKAIIAIPELSRPKAGAVDLQALAQGAAVSVPAMPPPLPVASPCPSCLAPMQPKAVLCVQCGYDKRTGVRLTNVVVGPSEPPARAVRRPAVQADDSGEGGFFGLERKGIRYGMVGGLVMMGIAGVWFFVGFQNGYIFYYPPVLFLIGAYAFLKGMLTGNINGE